MPSEWCIVVRPAETASSDVVQTLWFAFQMRKPQLDWGRTGSEFHVFVEDRHRLEQAEKAVMRMLAESDLVSAVVRPFPLGRWSESMNRYVVVGSPDEKPVERAIGADEIGWVVTVQPASAFDWRAARAELARRGRLVIGETNRNLEVGARDEEDSAALVESLRGVRSVASAEARPLSWFRRWRVRQQLLGNYSGRDPVSPL